MKISILIPTYNDSKYLKETLNSIFFQTYDNYEVIIIDDGSIDETKKIIEEYIIEYDKNKKIKYIYQENQDQLNAILNGINYLTGDYVTFLHSDDIFPDNNYLYNLNEFIKEHKEYDSFIGDLIIIDENSQKKNIWKALPYNKNSKSSCKLILNNGANIYGDVGIHKKNVYLNQIKNNYLTWNTPFWIDFFHNGKILKVKNIKFPIYKYRIHTENYVSNEVGKFGALNGELRTLINLCGIYSIPFFSLQQFVFKILRIKGIRKLGLSGKYNILAKNKKTSKKKVYKLVKATIKNKYVDVQNIIFLDSLLGFYKNNESNKKIKLKSNMPDDILKGKDIREFTRLMFASQLPDIYVELMKYMKEGFSEIIVKNEEEKIKVLDLINLMCILPYCKVKIGE